MVSFEVPHRVGNGMGGALAGFGDGGSAHSGDSLMSRSFSLSQGDKLLMRNGPRPDFGVGDLAPQKLPYRLVADTKGNTQLTPYSTTTHTEWDFISGNADDQAIPLVQLDYQTDLDLAGRAERASAFSVKPVVVGSAQGRALYHARPCAPHGRRCRAAMTTGVYSPFGATFPTACGLSVTRFGSGTDLVCAVRRCWFEWRWKTCTNPLSQQSG